MSKSYSVRIFAPFALAAQFRFNNLLGQSLLSTFPLRTARKEICFLHEAGWLDTKTSTNDLTCVGQSDFSRLNC